VLRGLRPLLVSAVERAASAARASGESWAAVIELDAKAVAMTTVKAGGGGRASARAGEAEATAGRPGLVTTVVATAAVASRCHVFVDGRRAVLAAAAVAAVAVPVLPAVDGIAARLTGDCWLRRLGRC